MKEHLIAGSMQAAATLAAAYALQTDSAVGDEATNIITQSGLRWICVVGSIGGGLISMLIFPQAEIDPALEDENPKLFARLKKRSNQRLLAKVLSQIIGGLMFTPWLARMSGFDLTEDRVLAFSAFVSMFIVYAIHILSPKAEAFVDAWGDAFFKRRMPPGSPDENKK